ncbi:hypothetical protein DIE07_03465 [Burkholderia sp. Bp9002]|nr:hypothetical protein DIE18_35065 [Burkholderia sp. Bp9125]RQS15500.1 hypothetical protein DIE07_03465 [Burkholderia sp. Bp9002]
MVRRNPGRKGWKTLIRPVGAIRDDAVHDPGHACTASRMRALKLRRQCTRMARSCHAYASRAGGAPISYAGRMPV